MKAIKGVRLRERTIKRYLIDFRKYLENKNLAPLTIRSHIAAIKSFYNNFDIEIPKSLKSDEKALLIKEHLDIPGKEDLQEVLNACDPIEKAILLVGVSSGLSENEISNLKIGNFTKDANHNLINFFRGHTLKPTQAAYFRVRSDELIETYLKYVPFLTIQKELDISENPDFLRMKSENESFARIAATSAVERQEFQVMNREIAELKDMVVNKSEAITDFENMFNDPARRI